MYTEFTTYDCIGFDLDGTLYDELDFLVPLYQEISQSIFRQFGFEPDYVFENLLRNWLLHGNTADLFQKSLTPIISKEADYDRAVQLCIRLYRECIPVLQRSLRCTYMLTFLRRQGKKIFMVTDGNVILQNRKIDALELRQFFMPEEIILSREVHKNAVKKDASVCERCLSVLTANNRVKMQRVLFCGDRHVDEEFAHCCGFDFHKMINNQFVG